MSFLRKKEFSYIYQNENLFDNYTLLENVEIILNISNVQFDKEKFNKYLTYLRIADLTYQYVKDLSGGEKQRVALLIALLKSVISIPLVPFSITSLAGISILIFD